MSDSGISWAICKPASRSRQITTPAPHHCSVFYRPDALPAGQPTASSRPKGKCKWSRPIAVTTTLTATGTHVPYGITQCYLPPSRGDISALFPFQARKHSPTDGQPQNIMPSVPSISYGLHKHINTRTLQSSFRE